MQTTKEQETLVIFDLDGTLITEGYSVKTPEKATAEQPRREAETSPKTLPKASLSLPMNSDLWVIEFPSTLLKSEVEAILKKNGIRGQKFMYKEKGWSVVCPADTPMTAMTQVLHDTQAKMEQLHRLFPSTEDGRVYGGKKDSYTYIEPVRIEGALAAILFCRQQGYKVALYTMNWSKQTVYDRLKRNGIRPYLFDQIHIASQKNPKTFDDIFMSQGFGRVVMVGNSWTHDIGPALGRADGLIWLQGNRELGVKGTPKDIENYPVTVIQSVASLPDMLEATLAHAYDKGAWRDYWKKNLSWSDFHPKGGKKARGGYSQGNPTLFDDYGYDDSRYPAKKQKHGKKSKKRGRGRREEPGWKRWWVDRNGMVSL